MFEVERIMCEPRRDGTEQYEQTRTDRIQPTSARPLRDKQHARTEEHSDEPKRPFASAERNQRKPLERQPTVGCALSKPQRTGEFTERPIADVQRDHFLVQPQRSR